LSGCTLFAGFLTPRCGDGVTDLDRGEACDDGNNDDADGCEADCTLPACENGAADPGEICYSAASVVTFAIEGLPNEMVLADLNADGRPDIATANQTTDTVSVLFNLGGAQFAVAPPIAVGTTPGSVVAGDFNEDGEIDLAVANTGSDDISLLLGQ